MSYMSLCSGKQGVLSGDRQLNGVSSLIHERKCIFLKLSSAMQLPIVSKKFCTPDNNIEP